MTLVRRQCQMDATPFKSALPGKCSFCDIDLFTEHNGRVLVIECKEHYGYYGPTNFTGYGQGTALKALSALGATVVYAAGPYVETDVHGVYKCQVQNYKVLVKGQVPDKWNHCTPDEFNQFITNWYEGTL